MCYIYYFRVQFPNERSINYSDDSPQRDMFRGQRQVDSMPRRRRSVSVISGRNVAT